MKTSFTPPPKGFLSNLNKFNKVLAVLLLLYIHNSYNAQTATTFTATNAQISDTLVSGGIIRAQCLHTQDTLRASDAVIAEQNLDVQGNLNLTGNLLAPITSTATLGSINTLGPAVFNSSLKIANFAGPGTSKLYVDANGFLLKGPPIPTSWECVPQSPNWNIGGNNYTAFGYQGITAADIGTCDNADFVLKANNFRRQWIKTDGTISFGQDLNNISGGPEYKFHAGALTLSGGNFFGGPQIIFEGGSTYGDWGIEYTKALPGKDGLNFWKPYLSPNSNNNILFLADDGTIGMGTDNPNARLAVDAWNTDGITTFVNNNFKAFNVTNKNINKQVFVVYSDGKTRIGEKEPLPNGPHGNAMLAVDGKILAKEIFVNIHNSVWPDYVFSKNYKLKPLTELANYLNKEKHLPGIPSAVEIEEKGLSVNEMQVKQMEKIEELYLYVIELQKQIEELKVENSKLQKKIGE